MACSGTSTTATETTYVALGATSRYFEFFVGSLKIAVNRKESFKW